MSTATETEQIEELLELGCYMGPGERYLMLYEGILTITNRRGLAHWPGGNRRTIAILDAVDCVRGLTAMQWEVILGKLLRIKGGICVKAEGRRNYNCKKMPQAHPT